MNSLDARLLRLLRTATVHLSGEEIAADLAVAPSAIGERFGILRAAGFEIDLRPGFGYRLTAEPDRLIADDLWSRLPESTRLVREIISFSETTSTNDLATRLARQGAEAGLAIVAERQTAGRGRFGRRWDAADGKSVLCSFLLRPEMEPRHWTRLTTWAACGVAAACEALTGCAAAIKWPNDIYLGGRKAAGILIEMGASAGTSPFAVAGIGINVNQEESDFTAELRDAAISLRQVAGRFICRAEFLVRLIQELESRYASLNGCFSDLVAEATGRSPLLGEWIELNSGGQILRGLAESLDADGHLILRLENGLRETVRAGEATMRRNDSSPGHFAPTSERSN